MIEFEPHARAAALLYLSALLAHPVIGHAAPANAGKGKQTDFAALYHNYCSVCHGDKGDGRSRARTSLVPPPKNFTEPSARQTLTRDYMIAVTRDGKPGTAMAGWKRQLSDREIAGVVDYVRRTFMNLDLPANLARGRDIYQTTCSVCHGDKGDGNSQAKQSLVPPPRDFTTASAELSRSHMIFTVNKGHPKTAMASFASQLKPQEIEAVVDYIRTAFMPKSTQNISGTSAHGGKEQSADGHAHHHGAHEHGADDPSAPFPKGLKGNAARGGKFYAANCATCHGEKGDGKGPRAYFINPKPRNFIDPSARSAFSRGGLFSAISIGRRGSEMPAWNKVLDDQQIADVAEYVYLQFIKPDAVAQKSAATKK